MNNFKILIIIYEFIKRTIRANINFIYKTFEKIHL